MPVYREHHERYSYDWANEKGTPVEAARLLVARWNSCLDLGEPPYPDSIAFIRSLGTLIYLRRRNIDICIIPDIDADGFGIDPICLSCAKCQTP